MATRIAPVALSIVASAVLTGRVAETGFLALAVVAGLPHGAFDHKVARSTFAPRHGARWWQPFLAGYLALASAMLFAWWALPIVALPLFLLLSVLHFGDQDASRSAPCRMVRIVAHGGVPVIVSAACHPAAIAQLLAVLVPGPGQAHMVALLLGGPLIMLWLAAAAATLIAYAGSGQSADVAAATDLVLVTLLFAFAPPLIGFSLYFAVIHAPRAMAAAIPAGGMPVGEVALPLALTAIALAFGALIFQAGPGDAVEENVVRTAFLLLSALTVPHMWLDWRARSASTRTDRSMTLARGIADAQP
ncbi:Brp/Blh family beta-carotene 15,15'-dioxygenase [uncultured Sphingomonas sp.]|uniref:Brp/Blh family beta-carotene 15,15'-dioxygenase n=1 Tax=uncultured Sphingomonas sp. TaxID=158754 RepID=UPI0025CFD55E|nr:Brp/Blh family beta-carotene 15,15'-dioxygenase [uncultured Sphingomonas sp.]